MKVTYTNEVATVNRNTTAKRGRKPSVSEKDLRAIKRFLNGEEKYMVMVCADAKEKRTVYTRISNILRNNAELDCVRFARGLNIYIARRADVEMFSTTRSDGRESHYVC